MIAGSQAARGRHDPWRNLRIILYFNIPLIALLLFFDVWRVLVHGHSGGEYIDSVDLLTALHGDALPLVASFTLQAERLSAGVNVALMRELLFFNFILWVIYMPIAVIAFCIAVPKLGLRQAVSARYGGKIPPALVLIVMLALFLSLNVAAIGPPSTRDAFGDLIFRHWAGVLRYNFTSVLCSALAMILIIHIFDLWTAWRGGTPPKHEANPDRG